MREMVFSALIFCSRIPIAWKWSFFKGQVPVNGNVFRETYPNWHLTKTPLNEGRLPQVLGGSHDIEWVYNPVSFRVGVLISLAGMVWLFLTRRR